MDYLVSLGTTGETATLSADERKAIWKFTAKVVAGRIHLMAGIGGNNTTEVVRQLKAFDHQDYTAILSVSPYYNKPTQEGIYNHYQSEEAASHLTVIQYNLPGRTGGHISTETQKRGTEK